MLGARKVCSLLFLVLGCAPARPSLPPAIAPLQSATLIRGFTRDHLTLDLRQESYVTVYGILPWTSPAALYPFYPERLLALGPGVIELDLRDPSTRSEAGHSLHDYSALLVVTTAVPLRPSDLIGKNRQLRWENPVDLTLTRLLAAVHRDYPIVQWNTRPERLP